jgi:4-nitrophenyl phosphatase
LEKTRIVGKGESNSYKIDGLIFDMDGVLWRGEQLLPGAKDLLVSLKDSSIPFAFATNNATKTVDQISAEGQMRGLPMLPEQVFTSSMAAVSLAQSHLQEGAKLFVVGEGGLRQPLKEAGFELLPSAMGAQAVLVGLDREVTWDKLSEAAYAIQAGALFIGTNGDLSLPTEKGFAPGNGAILQALEVTTGISPIIVGKPEPSLFLEALKQVAADPENVLVVGDRLETDILGGIRAGMLTALVLTGVTSSLDFDQSSIQPDYIFTDLINLHHELLDA